MRHTNSSGPAAKCLPGPRAPQDPTWFLPAFPPHTMRAFQTLKTAATKYSIYAQMSSEQALFSTLSEEQKHSRGLLSRSHVTGEGVSCCVSTCLGGEVVPNPRGAVGGLDAGPRMHVPCASSLSGDSTNGPGRTQQARHRSRSYRVRALWRKEILLRASQAAAHVQTQQPHGAGLPRILLVFWHSACGPLEMLNVIKKGPCLLIVLGFRTALWAVLGRRQNRSQSRQGCESWLLTGLCL